MRESPPRGPRPPKARPIGNTKQRQDSHRGGRGPGGPGSSSDKGPADSAGGSRNRRRRPLRHNRRPLMSSDALLSKYFNLLDQHNLARKKYYEMFYRANDQQKEKLEKNFHLTGEALRNFESKLNPRQKESLDKELHIFKLDLIYSQNHELNDQGEKPVDGPHPDPHLTYEQLTRPSYKDDDEESVGTMEDYLRVKGIGP